MAEPKGSAPALWRIFRDPEWSSARRIGLFNVALALLVAALFLIDRGFLWRVPVLVAGFTLCATYAVGTIESESKP